MGEAGTASGPDLTADPLLANVPAHEGYKVLGGVVLFQKVGQGGMGAVYKGRHVRLGIDVALKVLTPPVTLTAEQHGEYVRRFTREARTAAQIDHPNLIRVYDVDFQHGIHFLVMHFMDGESAGDRLKRKGKLSEQEAVEVVLGAAEGLGEAHRKGIVHRDVKPDNVMIDKDGRVRVADLGLAKAVSVEGSDAMSLLTQTSTAMGTPSYMALEQFESAKDVGPQADVWSLGVTLYQLATDNLPWTGKTIVQIIAALQAKPMADPKEICPELSDGLCAIIKKALEKDVSKRYADCGAMAADLRGHLDSTGAAEKNTLADARAGGTKLALVTMTPPATKTMTLIADAALGARARGTGEVAATTPATMAMAPAKTRRGVAKLFAASAVLLLAAGGGVAGYAFLSEGKGGPSADEVAWRQAKVEAEDRASALEYDAAIATVDGFLASAKTDEFRPAARALKEELARAESELAQDASAWRAAKAAAESRAKAGEYEAAISAVGGFIASAKTARFTPEARALRDDIVRQAEAHAAVESAIAAAGDAEARGDLDEAIRHIRLALEVTEDAKVRERLSALERRRKVAQFLAEAADHEKVGKWSAARAKYEEALRLADNASKSSIGKTLVEVEQRIRLEEAVVTAERKIEAGKWRAAWDAVTDARASGLKDARLAGFARRAARALAPRKDLRGPLGVELVLVPGGEFRMGTEAGPDDEKPAHRVTVSSYYMGCLEVTRAQFAAFRQEAEKGSAPKPIEDREPAREVSWDEAAEFCRHLTSLDASGAKYRLPTEAEWEYAARGPSGPGKEPRTYPWGDDPPTPKHVNLGGAADGFAGVAPVGSFPYGATPGGVMDLVGNVAEWCLDWGCPYAAEAQVDPHGPSTGTARVVRGSAFAYDARTWSRAAARAAAPPGARKDTIGFRVVRELTDEEAIFEGSARVE